MHKFTTISLLVSILLTAPAWAETNELDLSTVNEITRDYFSSGWEGFDSAEDYTQWQLIQAAIKEQKYDNARQRLDKLMAAYPDRLDLMYTRGEVHLHQFEPESGLQLFEKVEYEARQRMENERGGRVHHQWIWQARLGQFRSRQMLGEYRGALDHLAETERQVSYAPRSEQQAFYLKVADSYQVFGDYAKVYTYLQRAEKIDPDATKIDLAFQRYGPALARYMYIKATDYYRQEQYDKATDLLQKLVKLEPENGRYIELYSQAHTRFVWDAKNRVKRLYPVFTQALREMTWAMDDEEYDDLYRHYTRMMTDRDMAYFVENNYRYYLPYRILKPLSLIELTLQEQGYPILR